MAIRGYYLSRLIRSDAWSGWHVNVELDSGLSGDERGLATYELTDRGVVFTRGKAPYIPEETELLGVPDRLGDYYLEAWKLVWAHARRRWPTIKRGMSEPSPYTDRPAPPPNAMSVADVAAAAGVSPATIRAYRARGQMPSEEGRDRHGHPWWHPAMIEAWLVQRPRSSRT